MATLQVTDDPDLLELMLEDLKAAPEQYRPTNFWEYYEQRFVPWLREHGLTDFRRLPSRGPTHTFTSIGATDLIPPPDGLRRLDRNRLLANRYTFRVPHWSATLRSMSRRLERWLMPGDHLPAQMLSWEYARARGQEASARPLEDLSLSMYGNPEDAFCVDGKWYTRAALFYYMQYAQAAKHHDFSTSRVYVELGSGGGKQAEIMHLAHPELCLVLFDLPPQLYVAHQFLSATFPGDVVPYATAHDTPDLSTLVAPGRIIFAGAWRFPDILNLQPDLFWNAASFQEMEPSIVANYLDFVNRSAGAVYLYEKMEGQAVASSPGTFGVLQKTTLEDYRRGLPDFTLASMSPTLLPTARTRPLHSDSYWRRTTPRP